MTTKNKATLISVNINVHHLTKLFKMKRKYLI